MKNKNRIISIGLMTTLMLGASVTAFAHPIRANVTTSTSTTSCMVACSEYHTGEYCDETHYAATCYNSDNCPLVDGDYQGWHGMGNTGNTTGHGCGNGSGNRSGHGMGRGNGHCRR